MRTRQVSDQIAGTTPVDTGSDGGGVSARWRVTRLRFCATINPTPAEIRGIANDTVVSFVPMEAVGENGGLNLEQTHPLGYVAKGYTYFRDNDVVIAKITPCFENGKGSLVNGLKNGIGFGTTELHVFRPCSRLDGKYLFYLTLSHAFRKIGASYMYGAGGQKRVPDDFIRDFRIAFPPLNEQRTIASYLDHETRRVDALIEKKQKQIELLQEKRTALISHAVTKGLNPNAKMKDSGVEWLGPVPEGWAISKLGFHASVKARLGWKGLKADEYVDEGFIFLSTPNIKNRHIDFDDVNYITKERYLESPEIMLEVGDVLIAKDGSTLGTTNVVYNLPAPATVNSSIAILRPKSNLNSGFLYWIMTCPYTQSIIQQVKDGQGVPHLFQADLRKFWIWLPSYEEQRAITAFLNRETARINAQIEKIEKSIALLREYRTSLISAAVTGKIDVRKEVA